MISSFLFYRSLAVFSEVLKRAAAWAEMAVQRNAVQALLDRRWRMHDAAGQRLGT